MKRIDFRKFDKLGIPYNAEYHLVTADIHRQRYQEAAANARRYPKGSPQRVALEKEAAFSRKGIIENAKAIKKMIQNAKG
jgi:hypothetical protein